MLFVPQYAIFSESFVCSISFGAHPVLCGNRKMRTNVSRIAGLIRFFIAISLSSISTTKEAGTSYSLISILSLSSIALIQLSKSVVSL